MSVAATLQWQFRGVHGLSDTLGLEHLGPEAAARYACMVVCEDVIINGVLGARAPMALSTWQRRTGLSELPPLTRPADRRAWAGRVRIEGVALRSYARAVHAATDAYLAGLAKEADDLQCGDPTVCVLNALLLSLAIGCRGQSP